MRIDVISDTICPWCFIGKRRLERALAMRDPGHVDIHWRPFQLNPGMPADGMDRQKYLAVKFGGADRAERQYDRIRQAGREEGIAFRFDLIERTPNTVNSHRLLSFADRAGLQDVVSEALYRAYFFNGRDIGSIDELVALAEEAGLEGARTRAWLESDAERAAVLAEDEKARLTGITGVPCFIIEDRYAVSGAQSPEVFLQIFDVVREERTGQPSRALAD